MPRPPARPDAVRPSRQSRSLRTQERILDAMETLLGATDGAEITMERLAEQAHVSVGAIYKRIHGKDSLLPLVLERVHEQQLARTRALLQQPHWPQVGLAGRIAALLDAFADSQLARRRLIRALVVSHWQSADRAPMEARSAELLGEIHAWLSEREEEIHHPQPRLALSLGLFTTLQALQNAILFDRVPPALGLEGLVAEMTRMLGAYLGLAPDGGAAGTAGSGAEATARDG